MLHDVFERLQRSSFGNMTNAELVYGKHLFLVMTEWLKLESGWLGLVFRPSHACSEFRQAVYWGEARSFRNIVRNNMAKITAVSCSVQWRVWLGGQLLGRWTCDWRSRVQSQPLHCRVRSWTSCSHTLSSASGVTALWRYINQFKLKK